jgi:hypothetical protein
VDAEEEENDGRTGAWEEVGVCGGRRREAAWEDTGSKLGTPFTIGVAKDAEEEDMRRGKEAGGVTRRGKEEEAFVDYKLGLVDTSQTNPGRNLILY